MNVATGDDPRTIDLMGRHPITARRLLLPEMVHPRDTRRRDRLRAWYAVRGAIDASIATKSEKVEIPTRLAMALVDAAEAGVGQDFDSAVLGGFIAGDCLLTMLEIAHLRGADLDEELNCLAPKSRATAAGKIRQGGEHLAQFVVSKIYSNTKVTNQKGKPFRGTDRDRVREYWRTFSDVAHLWAAFQILQREAESAGTDSTVDSAGEAVWVDGLRLAGIAAALRDCALAETMPRGAVLKQSALKIVGVQPITTHRAGPSHFILRQIPEYIRIR